MKSSEQFDISEKQIIEVLEFAARSLAAPVPVTVPAPTPLLMLILFDHGNGLAAIARFLPGHTVAMAKDQGWDTLSNGDLLAEAERAGFDVFLTADKNIQYQQNLASRRIAVVVLSTPQWPLLRMHTAKIAAAVNAANARQLCRDSDSVGQSVSCARGTLHLAFHR